MWVKTESGQLYNLAHVRLIEVYPSGDELFTIVAHYLGSETAHRDDVGINNPLFVELTPPHSATDAQKLFSRICESLEMKETFLDLSRPLV